MGIGLSERYAINQPMMNHVENVLKEDVEAKEKNQYIHSKLATIIENEDELEKYLDKKMKMILITSWKSLMKMARAFYEMKTNYWSLKDCTGTSLIGKEGGPVLPCIHCIY